MPNDFHREAGVYKQLKSFLSSSFDCPQTPGLDPPLEQQQRHYRSMYLLTPVNKYNAEN